MGFLQAGFWEQAQFPALCEHRPLWSSWMVLSRSWVVSSHTCTEQMSMVLCVLSSLWSFVPRTLAAMVSPDSQPLSSAREAAELCWAPSLSRVLETQITGLTLFLSCLSDIAVLCFLMSSVLKPIVACISACLAVWLFQVGRVHLVPVAPLCSDVGIGHWHVWRVPLARAFKSSTGIPSSISWAKWIFKWSLPKLCSNWQPRIKCVL